MYSIFISYSHRDKKIADAICVTLEHREIRCWIAHRDIIPSAPWGSSIIDAINNSHLFVLVFSSHSNSSNQVYKEVERAVNKGIPIISFRIEKIEPSGNLEYFLSATQRLDAFMPPMEEHLNRLTHTVKELLQKSHIIESESSSPPSQPSIAVLPFKNMSADEEQEYFCEGIAEEIINALAHIEGLLVVARTSSFSFKDKNVDIREIGRKLNVSTILEGSVRKGDTRLRITAQLINVEDGYHLFSERFDRTIEDVFTIQDEITLAIVDKLKIELLCKEKAAVVKRYTENIEAYNSYLLGRHYWSKRTEEGFYNAIEYFNRAIEKDPQYALAYAGLADSYSLLTTYSNFSSTEAYEKAKKAVQKALEIDNTLAEAHASLAGIKMDFEWDWTGAEKEFKKAIMFNPGYASAHQWYASLLVMIGRFDDAIEGIKRASELDPLSKIIYYVKSQIYRYSGEYDKSMEFFQKALTLHPDFWLLHYGIGTLHCEKGNFTEAVSALKKAKSLSGDLFFTKAALGYIYGISGNKTKTKKILKKLLAEKKNVSFYLLALLYLSLGEYNRVLECLEKACEERDTLMTYIKVEPEFKILRSDPRFKKLLKKMRLE